MIFYQGIIEFLVNFIIEINIYDYRSENDGVIFYG